MPHPLDNPIWASLQTHHARFAQRDRSVARYPRDIGPFVGTDNPAISNELSSLVAQGELVYFLGTVPSKLGDEWDIHAYDPLPQLVCESRVEPVAGPGPEIATLGEAHRNDMLALTARVYPGYFRLRTPDIGGYIGIYQDGVLAAMAGERMRCHNYVEMSGICTHPDYLGRGYAQCLLAKLTNSHLELGNTPFLHVNRDNIRARSLYERLGYRERTALPFVSVTRGSNE